MAKGGVSMTMESIAIMVLVVMALLLGSYLVFNTFQDFIKPTDAIKNKAGQSCSATANQLTTQTGYQWSYAFVQYRSGSSECEELSQKKSYTPTNSGKPVVGYDTFISSDIRLGMTCCVFIGGEDKTQVKVEQAASSASSVSSAPTIQATPEHNVEAEIKYALAPVQYATVWTIDGSSQSPTNECTIRVEATIKTNMDFTASLSAKNAGGFVVTGGGPVTKSIGAGTDKITLDLKPDGLQPKFPLTVIVSDAAGTKSFKSETFTPCNQYTQDSSCYQSYCGGTQ